MDDERKSIHFMIGSLHITIFNKWNGFEYANHKGALGWSLTIGFITFWGAK